MWTRTGFWYYTVVILAITEACVQDIVDGSSLQGFTFKTLNNSRMYLCAAECVSYPNCKSFNFDKNTRRCFLNFENQANVAVSLQPATNVVYSDISAWTGVALGPCQTQGCGSTEKCVVTRTGAVTCKPITANVALQKVAKASSELNNPILAVDGSASAGWLAGSCWASGGAEDTFPWWQVDLGDVYLVTEVRILNRADCCYERLHDFAIEVSDDDSTVVQTCLQYRDTYRVAGGTLVLSCTAPVSGRYLTIRAETSRPDSDRLQMCEVQVIALLV